MVERNDCIETIVVVRKFWNEEKTLIL